MKPRTVHVMYGILTGMGMAIPLSASFADPTDPNAAVPPTRYESAFDQYQARHGTPQLNWKTLFTTDAAFNAAATEIPEAPSQGQMPMMDYSKMGHGGMEHSMMGHGGMDHSKMGMDKSMGDQPAKPDYMVQADTKAKSDTRGRIESINKADGKVKLKHGPIPKFEMPSMTMVFRVQDPKLLDQVKVGDEVGVTMEQRGGLFVITGFQD